VPEQFIVETVLKREEWEGDYGPMINYLLVVNGGKEVDLNQKPSTPAPTQGQEILGHLEDGKYRPRLKRDQAGTTTTSGGAASYSRGGKSPDQQRSIVRQHSQEMALRWIAIGGPPAVPDDEAAIKVLRYWTDFFEADANSAQAASEGGGSDAQQEASRSSPPSSPQNGQQTHERLAVLLEAAGVNDVAARTIADHAMTEMSAEEQDAAVEMLENETRRGAAVKRLSERTVKATGQPLPRPTADDEIPF
jgi:hypothetical protein